MSRRSEKVINNEEFEGLLYAIGLDLQYDLSVKNNKNTSMKHI